MSTLLNVQEKIAKLECECELAKTEYRETGQRYISLHGRARDEYRHQLETTKAAYKHLEMELSNLMVIYYQEMIEEAQSEKEKQKIQKELEAAKLKVRKLLSMLDHDEWLEFTRSVWGFKETESQSKTGKHPAQFSAVLPYRLIKMYSFVGDTVLDPFNGTGTTLLEAQKLHRNSIGVDVDPYFLNISRERIGQNVSDYENQAEQLPGFNSLHPTNYPDGDIRLYTPHLVHGDVRRIPLADESIDIVVTHPPYWNAVQISKTEHDLSMQDDYKEFMGNMEIALHEMIRVLKKDRVLAIVTGDVMRKIDGITKLYALHSDYIQIVEKMGAVLWDLFIWETKIKLKGGKPMMGSYPYPHKIFSQFSHNYVLVFRKNQD